MRGAWLDLFLVEEIPEVRGRGPDLKGKVEMLGAHGEEEVATWPMWEAWGWGKGGGEQGPEVR